MGRNSEGYREVGNWVLTAPKRKHTSMRGVDRVHQVLLMLTAKSQLHVRIFYDEEEEMLRFYSHYEYNPYNPFYAKRHFNGENIKYDLARSLFKSYAVSLEHVLFENYSLRHRIWSGEE